MSLLSPAAEVTQSCKSEIIRRTVPFDKLEFPHLLRLSRERMKTTVSIYDLETSSFRNTWNFGITELSMLHINPDGSMYVFSSLFNPGKPISPIVSEKTGITDAMVKGAPLWGDLGAPLFHYLTHKGNNLFGYNNRTFDRWCVLDSNAAALSPCSAPAPEKEFDVYPVVRAYFKKSMKLGVAAENLGFDESVLERGFHRAADDVVATAFVADRLLGVCGEDLFLEYAKYTPSKNKKKKASADLFGE